MKTVYRVQIRNGKATVKRQKIKTWLVRFWDKLTKPKTIPLDLSIPQNVDNIVKIPDQNGEIISVDLNP